MKSMFKGMFGRIGTAERPQENDLARFASEARYKFAADYIVENSNLILDIGCGEGWGLNFLLKGSRRIVAVDYSKEGIVVAKDRFKDNKNCYFMAMNACCLAFKNKIFDTVCAFEIVEHLKNTKEFFKEIERVLKDKGTFILSTPNKNYLSNTPVIKSPFHVKEYSSQELREELEGHFEVEGLLGFSPKFKKIEENPLFIPYMRMKKFFHLEKLMLSGKIRARLFGGSKTGDYCLSEKDLENCSNFFVICRKKDG